jgi:Flp pilus assembly protein TadG
MPRQLLPQQFRKHRSRRGVALIEFAMVVPWLVLMILGIMEFGWYAKNQLTVANATREGARVASLGRPVGEVKLRVRKSAAPIKINDDDVTLQYSRDSGSTYINVHNKVSGTQIENDAPAGSLLKVTVTAPHRSLTSLSLFGSEIKVAVTMVRERS